LRGGDTAIAYYIDFDRVAAAEGLPLYLRLRSPPVETNQNDRSSNRPHPHRPLTRQSR
jgi:hypothetical protein